MDLSSRTPDILPLQYIENCPECHTPLVRIEGEAKHFCPNEIGCPPQKKGKIVHFIHRKAMNIDGLGEETVELLYEKGLIKNVADLYELKKEQLVNLERLGEKSAENILKSIENSKAVSFEKVLFALGIRYVGETVAKKLARAFFSIDSLMNASFEDLIQVDEIGDKIAESIIIFFKDLRNIELIQKLKNAGIQMEQKEVTATASTVLSGLSFVISGVFQKHSRDELKIMIEENGGKNTGSVSVKTSYLLAGENIGPAKLEKAQKLGVKIISEDEFLKMIVI